MSRISVLIVPIEVPERALIPLAMELLPVVLADMRAERPDLAEVWPGLADLCDLADTAGRADREEPKLRAVSLVLLYLERAVRDERDVSSGLSYIESQSMVLRSSCARIFFPSNWHLFLQFKSCTQGGSDV